MEAPSIGTSHPSSCRQALICSPRPHLKRNDLAGDSPADQGATRRVEVGILYSREVPAELQATCDPHDADAEPAQRAICSNLVVIAFVCGLHVRRPVHKVSRPPGPAAVAHRGFEISPDLEGTGGTAVTRVAAR